MAKATFKLVNALKTAARKLEKGDDYQWGHMGSCNCGFLAREISKLTKAQIHEYAMRKSGDWSEQINDFCDTSEMPFDLLLSEMLQVGLEREDLIHLEKLTDKNVLKNLPKGKFLMYNIKKDVILYMRIWADLLEEEIIEQVQLEGFTYKKELLILS